MCNQTKLAVQLGPGQSGERERKRPPRLPLAQDNAGGACIRTTVPIIGRRRRPEWSKARFRAKGVRDSTHIALFLHSLLPFPRTKIAITAAIE